MCRETMSAIVLTLALILAGGARADTTTGLIGYWPLDGDAVDAGGNGLNGTITGNVTPTTGYAGTPNSAMECDGAAGSYIDLGNGPRFQITGKLTLSAWVLLKSDNTNNCRIIAKAGGAAAGVGT